MTYVVMDVCAEDNIASLLKTEFPDIKDWIFRMMFPGDRGKSVSSGTPFSSVHVVAFLSDDSILAKQSTQGFLFQAALSACSFGGTAVYVATSRIDELPVSVMNMPFPDVCGLKKLKLIYGPTPKELVRSVSHASFNPSVYPVVICVEDILVFCGSAAKLRNWTIQRALACLLSHFEEVIQFSQNQSTPVRIVFSMSSADVYRDILRRLDTQMPSLGLCSLYIKEAGGSDVHVQTDFVSADPLYSFRKTVNGLLIKPLSPAAILDPNETCLSEQDMFAI